MLSVHLTLILSILAICFSFASAIAAFGQWQSARRQIGVQNLLQMSQYLHQTEYRDARQAVRNASKDQLSVEMVRKVCSSFDFAGLLVRHKLIDEMVFLEYWGPLLLFFKSHLHETLDQSLFGELSLRHYYRHFEWLMERAASCKSYPHSLR
jgi:hypothetical protein